MLTTIKAIHLTMFLCRVRRSVWWISIGRFVLLTPRFWELLIGVNKYKGHLLNNVPLSRAYSTSAHVTKEHR